MADQTKVYGSVKRYGVRYGTKLKGKIGKIEAERRASTKCPYCSYNKTKRIAMGIWACGKCKSKFTGKAYTIGGNVVVREIVGDAVQQAAAKEERETAEASEEAEEDYDEEEDSENQADKE